MKAAKVVKILAVTSLSIIPMLSKIISWFDFV